mmetsp:Transcript_16508/g.14881  ORF Transcript_16508/g.14881 Transcript_16508/m.14881 type:complete len:152 (-) Transcript_16508:22-477(-)
MTCYICCYNIVSTEYDNKVCSCVCPIYPKATKNWRETKKLDHLIDTFKIDSQLSIVTRRAKRIFESGNNIDKNFAESLDKTVVNLIKKDKYIVLKCLNSLKDCEVSRKSVREKVEDLEVRSKKRSSIIEEWHKFYSEPFGDSKKPLNIVLK